MAKQTYVPQLVYRISNKKAEKKIAEVDNQCGQIGRYFAIGDKMNLDLSK
jgi:hypothetical protein